MTLGSIPEHEPKRLLMSTVGRGLIGLLCLAASLRTEAATQQAQVPGIKSDDTGSSERPKDAKQYPRLVEDPARLERKDFEFDQRTIPARYLAELLTHPKNQGNTIFLESCCVDGTLDLRNKQVCGLVVGRGLFTGSILLDGAKVRGGLRLQGGERIEGGFSANHAEFFEGAAFYGTSFRDGVQFSSSKFDQEAEFLDVEITGEEFDVVQNHKAQFSKCPVPRPVDVREDSFQRADGL